MDALPNVSICMPIYNRNNFKQLIVFNLKNQMYPHDKIELVIVILAPMTLKYHYRPHRISIGVKRNNLTKLASHKIIACMDSDDIYMPQWLLYSVSTMKEMNATCVGSNQMLFVYPHHNWSSHAIRCEAKRQIHEACMVYTKNHHRSMGGFRKTSQGEGSKMADFNEKNVALLDIDKCMCCIVHPDNTINKDMFMKEDNKIDLEIGEELKSIVEKALGI